MEDFFRNVDKDAQTKLFALIVALIKFLAPKVVNLFKRFVIWLKWKKGDLKFKHR